MSKLKLVVDCGDISQVELALKMLNGISDSGTPSKAKPEKAKPEKAKPEKAKPEKAKPEKAKPEKAKPEKAKQEDPEEENEEINISSVRALVAKKAAKHKDSIKEMMSELGANNVTGLDPSKYQELMDFLNSLK